MSWAFLLQYAGTLLCIFKMWAPGAKRAMHSKGIQEDTGDTAAHVNRGKAHQTWKRRNEPQMGRQTGTQQREGRAAAAHSSHVVCSVLWDWVVQQSKTLLQTPLRAGAAAPRSCLPSLNQQQAAFSEDRDLPSKPCLMEV